MIVFENVTKRYGRATVLDGINLTIKDGEFVCLIGPSGAGKSTLVFSLMGAENIQRGNIVVDGYTVNKMSERSLQFFRRRIGVVFQDYKLLPQKNVYENVAFAMEVCGAEKKDIKKRVPEVLGRVGLHEKHRQFPHQLSGGERQRVAVARALVHNPGLLMADEPTGNLDPKTAKEIINLFLKINDEGTTVILATHNTELIKRLNKRTITLESGKIAGDKII